MPPVPRRAHHKSRGGCTLCKTRKIKCNEALPCSYCVKKGVSCSLGDGQARPSSRTAEAGQQPEDQSFRFSDFALYRHFVTRVAFDHADDEASVVAWSEGVGQLATQYDYVMHQVLSLSALHLQRLQPENAVELSRVAVEHQQRALPLLREALARDWKGECLAIFVCSVLIVPTSFAGTTCPVSLIYNGETGGSPEWLNLLDGATHIIDDLKPVIMESPMRPILGPIRPFNPDDIDDSPDDRAIVVLIETLPYPDGRKGDYVALIKLLRHFYTLSNRGPTTLDMKSAALRFPPFFSRTGKDDLGKREPAALVVMAFWLPLLYRIEDRWWLKDRVHPVVRVIHDLLDPEYQKMVKWPMEQVGLRPVETK